MPKAKRTRRPPNFQAGAAPSSIDAALPPARSTRSSSRLALAATTQSKSQAKAPTPPELSMWQQLPNELLLLLLSTVHSERDALSCGCVCTLWRDAGRREAFWQGLLARSWLRTRPLETSGCE
jgi:hypothetical protein